MVFMRIDDQINLRGWIKNLWTVTFLNELENIAHKKRLI
jgi:hypothetical protein